MSELILVEQLMVPVEEYARVGEDATLFEAIMALEEAQENQDREHLKYLHRAVLVTESGGDRVVGKISQLIAIQALEPKYKDIGDLRTISAAGFSSEFIQSMMENFRLCETSLMEVCSKGASIKVKDFMQKPEPGEFVEADADICVAIHQFIIGQHQSLLVLENEEIVGILRLTDVFMKIFKLMKQCTIGE
jgi:CBS domain-containing protein